MGQYYTALMIGPRGKRYRLRARGGIKLMEHSWMGNESVHAVMMAVQERPMRIAWIGDYADDVKKDFIGAGGGFIKNASIFMKLFGAAWNDNSIKEPPAAKRDIDCPPHYLVNKTKKVYLDMEAYEEANAFCVDWSDEPWCVHPLPLLTAVGNGQGSGDYFGSLGKNFVGTWAFDEIFTTNRRPGEEYTEVTDIAFKDRD